MIIPDGFSQVTPYVFAQDAAAYIAFLEQALNGREAGRSLGPDGRIANSQVRFGAATIMVSDASPAFPPSQAALYLYIENADAAMKQAIDHGATLIMDVSDMPYGDRQGGIRDPSGNIWWLSQRLIEEPYF